MEPALRLGEALKADGQVVGMGRIIGDGGCFYTVVDIAVAPSYQGKGLGKRIMNALDAWLRTNAEPSAYVISNNQEEYAYLGAKWLFQQMGGKGEVLYMRGAAGASADSDRDKGFKRALAELEAAGRVRAIGRARAQRWLSPPLTGFTTILLLPAALPIE